MEKAYCEKMEGTRIGNLVYCFHSYITFRLLMEWYPDMTDPNEESEKAEELFKNDKRVTSAVTVFHEDDLITGVSLKTFSRFKKGKIEKELKKKMEKLYPEKDVTVSADSKIWMETNKLIDSDDKKDNGKKIEKLKSLIKGRDMMDEKKYAELEKDNYPQNPH